ncbi:MAG: hypothetical protein COB02_12380 [Candidatus Cloacimonadota bacterium]|nr:MAG: hypothetical protein COB02_12380 [Candidatus Cloacimonadota bacterium]
MQITEELIRQLVIEVVEKLEAMKESNSIVSNKSIENFHGKLLTGEDIEYCFKRKVDTLLVPKKTIITPLGRERSNDLGVKIEII